MEEIEEGKLSDAAARLIALAIKKRVINKGREVRSTQDSEKKIRSAFSTDFCSCCTDSGGNFCRRRRTAIEGRNSLKIIH